MSIASFGSGLMYATNTALNSTPLQIGALQDVSVDVSRSIKPLYGQYQQPLKAGVGEEKVAIKAKMGYISAAAYAAVYYGIAPSVGTTRIANNEAATIPATTPWQVTVVNSATFVNDLGVQYSATGLPFNKVASAPTIGQYSVSAGVYTFATADASAAVLVSYSYTVAGSGQTLNIGLLLQGVQPLIILDIYRGYNNTGERHRFWSCVCGKLSTPTKLADFAISEMDFEAFANAAGQYRAIYTDE